MSSSCELLINGSPLHTGHFLCSVMACLLELVFDVELLRYWLPAKRAALFVAATRLPLVSAFVNSNSARSPVFRVSQLIHPSANLIIEHSDDTAFAYIPVLLSPLSGNAARVMLAPSAF